MNKLFTFLIVIASLYMAASIELVGAGFDEYAEGDGLNIEKYDEDMEDFSDFQRLLGRRKPRRKPKKTCRDGKRCRKNSDCRRGGCTVRRPNPPANFRCRNGQKCKKGSACKDGSKCKNRG